MRPLGCLDHGCLGDDHLWVLASGETLEEATREAFADVVALGGVSVICSQGGIMPDIIAWLSDTGRLPIDGPISVKKGGVWVLSFSGDDLTGADYIPSALPVR